MAGLSGNWGRTASLAVLTILPLLVPAMAQLPPIFPRTFTIGAALSEHKYCTDLERFLNDVNNDPEALPAGLTLNSSCVVMSSNPIVAAEMVCDTLIGSQMYMAISSHSQQGDLSPMSVSFTCGFYSIPIIGISTRDSAFSDRNVHTGFLRTVAPYSEQSEIWVEMLQTLEFKLVIFIHSTDQEGRAMLSKFQTKIEAKDVEVRVEQNIPYTAGQSNFSEVLSAVQRLTSRVILLYASAADAKNIYRDAEALDLFGSDYAWIVTEQSLLEPTGTPLGILGLKLLNSKEEERHLQDSVRIITKAVSAMARQGVNISAAPSNCDRGDTVWFDGYKILESLMNQKLTPNESQTGLVQFNEVGDRIHSHYQVYNKQKDDLEVVGTYGKDRVLMMAQDSIIWPGNSAKPKGIKISTHLKVVTGAALPFVYATEMIGDSCEPLDRVKKQVPCPRKNVTTGELELFCCHGYCIDLLDKLSVEVNFTYEVHLSSDGLYGSYDRTRKSWNGMIGELIDAQADMIVAPLTINPERAIAIDFTKPFKYQGMTILVKKTIKDSNLASFLQPFQNTLWILVGLSVHVVALVLYLLDRFSPFGRFKLAKSDDTEEDALNLSGAVWFAWGVLLNSGIGEGTPRSFSARVLGMVWAGFAMIIVASYTANLAAFLVLDRPVASISGIDDARLRNPQDEFKYATVRDSSVAMYFKRQVELSTMYRTMEKHFANSEQEAIQEIKQGDLDAFIWDSSRLDYEAAQDCDLVTAGELFGRSGYGIGLAKGSPWTEEISLKILSFHETGTMEELDNSWILMYDTKCPERDASPATLGLTNMAGVFMMVAGGIVAGVFLIFIEIAYKRHRGLKEKELELAKTAADRWRGNIEKRRTLRRTLLQQQQERNKAKNGTTESPAHSLLTQPSPGRVPAGYQPVATNIKSSSLPV